MCVADLNASNTSCGHSWYRLQRPCSPGTNLHTCDKRVAISGWEQRHDACPFCSGWPVNLGEYILLGSHSRRSSTASNALSRSSSMSTPVSSARRDSKSTSLSRTSSTSSMHAVPVPSTMPESPVWNAGERNRGMRHRFDNYLSNFHHHVRSGAVTPRSRHGSIAEGSDEDGSGAHKTDDSASDLGEMPSFPRSLSKGWSSAKRKSKDLSHFFR